MNTNIFRHEFRMHLKSMITWSLSIALLIFVFVTMLESFTEQAEALNAAMAKFPPALLTAFGMNDVNLATVLGYFGLVFLFTQLCLAIQAANYGFALVSVEEREWTADFLLAKPVGRATILTSKLLAALVCLTITNAVVWAASFGFLALYAGPTSYEHRPLIVLLASIVVFQLFFFSVGLAVSLLVKRIRNVTPYAMGLAFGMYVLSVFGDMLGESVLEKVTPFQHFKASAIVESGKWDTPMTLVSVAVIVVALVSSYLLYARRNIPAVV